MRPYDKNGTELRSRADGIRRNDVCIKKGGMINMSENLHDIVDEKILSQSGDSAEIEIFIPASSDFFDGHFPEFKLLPAVAQFEIITRFSKKYFGTERYVPEIKRIKFSAPIRPDTLVRLKLEFNREKKSMSFLLRDAKKSDKAYSSGIFVPAV